MFYSQTLSNDHLRKATTCLRRPPNLGLYIINLPLNKSPVNNDPEGGRCTLVWLYFHKDYEGIHKNFACYFSALGFQQFLSQDSDVTLEIVEEGKEHIKREKRRRQRLLESQTRRRDFATRFGDGDERGKNKKPLHCPGLNLINFLGAQTSQVNGARCLYKCLKVLIKL